MDAIANGWRVAPIAPGAKAPNRMRNWKDEATDDPAQVREWWAEVPYNIAGLTGRYLVLDVDIADGKPGMDSMNRLTDEYGLPDTRIHQTPSGGLHYIFECPPDWEIHQRHPLHPDYPAVDLKAGDSYVVLPPSRRDTGSYTVVSNVAPVRAPDWILELFRGPATVQTVGRTKILLDELPPGTIGTRDNTLTRLAGRLRRNGQDEAAIYTALCEYQAGWARPLPDPDIRRIATSAMRWAPNVMGGLSDKDTDLDNARLTMRVADDNLRWRSDDSRWTVWDGRKWGTDAYRFTYTMEVLAVLDTMIERVIAEQGPRAAKDLLQKRTAIKMANRNHAMWKMMSHLPGVTRQNEEFDADPYLLNVQNGVVDLRTGDLLPHDKKLLLSKIAAYEYDPKADYGEWDDFVLWCCAGNAEQAHWLQVVLGQALIGTQLEHMVVFMFGTGANGKTQITDAILRTIGDYGLESSAELLIAKGKDSVHVEMVASLFGSRIVVCPEPEKGSYWAAARVKSLTGGDEIRARHLYGREFSFKPSHTLIVHGNYQPEIRDLSMGFRRRMNLVPFSSYIRPEDRVKNYGEKLAGPGVLRWLVQGAVYYCANGIPPSQRVRAATEAYIGEQDQFARFVADTCTRDSSGWEAIGDLYSVYQFWARREGLRFVETKQEMAKWLMTNGFRRRPARKAGSTPRTGYDGLTINMATRTEVQEA